MTQRCAIWPQRHTEAEMNSCSDSQRSPATRCLSCCKHNSDPSPLVRAGASRGCISSIFWASASPVLPWSASPCRFSSLWCAGQLKSRRRRDIIASSIVYMQGGRPATAVIRLGCIPDYLALLLLGIPQTMRRLRDEGRLEQRDVVERFGFIFMGYRSDTSWWCAREHAARPLATRFSEYSPFFSAFSNIQMFRRRRCCRESVIMIRKLAVVGTTVFLVGGACVLPFLLLDSSGRRGRPSHRCAFPAANTRTPEKFFWLRRRCR